MLFSRKASILMLLGVGVVVAAAVFGLTQLLKQTGELTRTRAFPERGTLEDTARRLRAPDSEEPAEALVPLIQGAFGLETPSRPR